MPRDRGLVSECHRHCLNGPVSPCFAIEISYVPDVSCESDREGGGCQGCQASIAVYNAYPSTSGYWRCADCIGTDGFATVADFTAHEAAIVTCPACGNADTISETRVTIGEHAEGYVLECDECREVWQL
jgi:hypothetical protein